MRVFLSLLTTFLALLGSLSFVNAASVRTDCGGKVACWHASDATADFVAFGTPDSDAQPLRFNAASVGHLVLLAFLPQAPRERIAEGRRVRVKVSGRGWNRLLEGRAFCKDGSNFRVAIPRKSSDPDRTRNGFRQTERECVCGRIQGFARSSPISLSARPPVPPIDSALGSARPRASKAMAWPASW